MRHSKTMSLKKKIALGFFISAFIIAILAAFEYVNFIEIKQQIRYLEITDTISRKSLQLRRHEKNYFLYSPQQGEEESSAVHQYIEQLRELLDSPDMERVDTRSFRDSLAEYERLFLTIEASSRSLIHEFEKTRRSLGRSARYLPLVEATFLEQPLRSAASLTEAFRLPRRHPLITRLVELSAEITALRKTGESIVVISKDLDKVAREKVETVIRVSQVAILIFFPLFFVVGIGTLFFISTSVVKRLMLLIKVVEKTGRGSYPHMPVPASRNNARDEVGVLIGKFNDMEDQLAANEAELERKNKELMQAKKLAAIGTLASGVAHELNNPLNNIYLSAQVLSREAGDQCPPATKEAVNDIVGQTARVKRIVGDLLEFARGREPHYEDVELTDLITGSYRRLAGVRDMHNVSFTLDPIPPQIAAPADRGQLEQVFANLFANAADAIDGPGGIAVTIRKTEESAVVVVADTGRGIPRESLDKVFEPFFTTKDKGTGLGLAIVYNIVKKHNGEIVAESGEGRGTTFTIALPLKQL